MAASREAKKLRGELASNLKQFKRVLNSKLQNCNLSPIEAAISQLEDYRYVPQIDGSDRVNNNNWGYDIRGILFNIDAIPDHTHPSNAFNLSLVFDIKVIADATRFGKIVDPYSHLEFNIVVKGQYLNQTDDSIVDLICSYHLDKHIENEGDGAPYYPHPDYHFQFGGRKLNKREKDFGCSLILDSPRIVHHPMDIVLGIDFILSNFFPDKWKELRKEGEYVNIVKVYQENFWRPYAHSKAWNWRPTNSNGEWAPSKIWPQLFLARQ